MKKAGLLIFLVLLSGCVNITDQNLKSVVSELRGEENVMYDVYKETDLMFDDSEYTLNIYNPNLLVHTSDTGEIGVTIVNIYSQPSQFDLRADSEYAVIEGDGVYLEPGEFSTKIIKINAPESPTKFTVHIFLDRGGNNIAASDVTVKVI